MMFLSARKNQVFLLLLSVTIFVIAFPHYEFIGFETRFALFAREMLQNGLSFFPTTYHQPYPDYPALSTFFIYAVSLPFQNVNYFSGHLPFALLATGILGFTYQTVIRFSRKWAWFSVFFILLTVEFYPAARSMTLDLYTCLASIAALYYKMRAEEGKKDYSMLAIAFGFFSRGLIGLVIPATVVFCYILSKEEWKKVLIFSCQIALLAIVLLSVLFAAAFFQGGMPFVKAVWFMQIYGRIDYLGANPFYFYVPTLFSNYAIAFPVALFTFFAFRSEIFSKNASKEIVLIRALCLATVLIVLGMTIPSEKKTRYILSIVPLISMVAGFGLTQPQENIFLKIAKKATSFFCIGMFLLSIAAAIYALHEHAIPVHYRMLLVLVLFAAIGIYYFYKTKKENYYFFVMLLGFISFASMQICLIEPFLQMQEKTRPFVAIIESQLDHKTLWFDGIGPDGEDIKFVLNMKKMVMPNFVKSDQDLRVKNRIFIVKEKAFHPSSKWIIIAKGKIGNKPVIAFEVKPNSDF